VLEVIEHILLANPEELGNLPQVHRPILQGLGDLFSQSLRLIIHFLHLKLQNSKPKHQIPNKLQTAIFKFQTKNQVRP
jgi:hypothetical protein